MSKDNSAADKSWAEEPMPNFRADFDVDIQMRDGTILRADVWLPPTQGRFPTLVYRTPYGKEYAPKAQAIIKSSGGRSLAASQNVTSVEGDAPKSRVALTVWDSKDQFTAYRNSAAFKELRATTGNKLAKFRTFTVEGAAQ